MPPMDDLTAGCLTPWMQAAWCWSTNCRTRNDCLALKDSGAAATEAENNRSSERCMTSDGSGRLKPLLTLCTADLKSPYVMAEEDYGARHWNPRKDAIDALDHHRNDAISCVNGRSRAISRFH
ncbi:hypothetical protein CORC01_05248 [Colletotrichum orchidophilum]|uniref:Uncharacterized protein n=1 Tax=Colletotrichum orchidophilum TaxID=1209926 RepID=A0A1G4BDI2_9PEZI|nr:uncharacterized protein CORC01_05248 [Colletotrichum orchidophilum]OHE99448.1 hypothetical protein CORC01_05248 [Colletotrichum orchidophilum]